MDCIHSAQHGDNGGDVYVNSVGRVKVCRLKNGLSFAGGENNDAGKMSCHKQTKETVASSTNLFGMVK